ncbi:hypothetical protein L227DRAFT_570031 [Lentinus tigrinus ALCF2SS1-6]|uniref:Uncharacterized protein n=2 Tax=Lentinus tigrinus TaxID=5365 RepID=A0A5C2SSQ9_9APHY|nr:hypothetical protein L227DRAFT_570031 [Lentinus tigrinus ALCF2SS1-6]
MAHFADVGKDESQGVIISQEKYRPYMFEEVRKTDDPKIAAPGSLDSLFGTIVVMLTAVEYWRPASKYTPFSLETVEDPRPIHSKDAVEGGHGVCFGRPESLPRSGCRPGKFGQVPVGSDEMEPFLCFCFIYMPKEILQTKGLIPKHSPKDSRRARTEDNDSVIDLSDETDDDRRVQSSAREGEAATLQAQLEAEVRKIQAQVNQLRRHLEMKKTLLAKLTKPYTPACSSRGKPKAIDLP